MLHENEIVFGKFYVQINKLILRFCECEHIHHIFYVIQGIQQVRRKKIQFLGIESKILLKDLKLLNEKNTDKSLFVY